LQNIVILKSRLRVTGQANLCTIYTSLISTDPVLSFLLTVWLYPLSSTQ